ncbi:MAG: capsule biosynthesis protein [Campylobacteraceae bacterium]
MNSIGDIKNQNILLLQGPMGSFFKRFDKSLRKKGAKTYKIAFNAGDWFFSNKDNVISFKDSPKNWKKFITSFYKEKNINKLFLFGDCRFYQQIAKEVAETVGVEVFVFEEGYIRPNYITLEKHGVNDNSKLPRSREFYDLLTINTSLDHAREMYNNFSLQIMSAIIYFIIAKTFIFLYPKYIHHRDLYPLTEAFYGIRSFFRKIIYSLRDEKYNEILSTILSKKYFFVPLQTNSDFQVRQHSNFKDIKDFIVLVLESFAKNASKFDYIIFKHHPLDRGRKNYTKLIYNLSKKLCVEKRVIVAHEINIPTALKNAKGTVTINSTVGLSSLYHETPTITLGKAIYNIDGLTCKSISIDQFWSCLIIPNAELFKKFRAYLIKNSQVNSSFYGKIGDLENI